MKRLLRAALALACSLFAVPVLAATLTATPATSWAVLGAAKPGDIVQLQAGDYGDLAAWNFKKAAPGVTIEPAPGAAVTISSINAGGSSNLTFTGFDVVMKPTTQYGLQAGGAGGNVVFDRMKVHQADASLLQGVGFWVRNGANVTIRNSEFYWLGLGGGLMDSDHVTISGNLIHDVGVDGIDLAGVTNVLVSRNVIHDSHPSGGAHPDGIQWWSTATTPTNGVEIAYNHIERGAGGASQGVFGEDGANVSIHDNELLGTMYNGIGLARTKGAQIRHNFVAGYPDMGTRIIVRGGCDAVTIEGNAAQEVVNYVTTTEPACTNLTIQGNTTIPAVQLGDLSALDAWKGVAVSTPPAADPLQVTVEALKAQVAVATQTAADTKAALAQAQQQLAAAQAQASALAAKVAAAKVALQ